MKKVLHILTFTQFILHSQFFQINYKDFGQSIFNCPAEDNATGIRNNVRITNSMGRPSKEEIERMVSDAERYKAEDEEHAKMIQAMNTFENYLKNNRNLIWSIEFGSIPIAVRNSLEDDTENAFRWLDGNRQGEVYEFEYKMQEVEHTCNQILARMGVVFIRLVVCLSAITKDPRFIKVTAPPSVVMQPASGLNTNNFGTGTNLQSPVAAHGQQVNVRGMTPPAAPQSPVASYGLLKNASPMTGLAPALGVPMPNLLTSAYYTTAFRAVIGYSRL